MAKLEGVKSVSVNFMTQKLTLEADDAEFDEVLNRVVEFTATPSRTARSFSSQAYANPQGRACAAFAAKLYERVFIHSNGRIRVMATPTQRKRRSARKRVLSISATASW
ncbi:MAG: heavy-metal-associated domain-containing protein [Collinsella sp.]